MDRKTRTRLKTEGAAPRIQGALGEFAAVAAGVFEEGEKVGHAEEGAGGLIEVDEFEFAAAGAARDVEGGESAEATGVHVMDLLHVDDDALFVGEQVADFVAEMGRVFGCESAVAFDDGGAVDAVGLDAKEGRGGLWIRRGLGRVGHVATPERLNASGL
jgi:hypothetical protein